MSSHLLMLMAKLSQDKFACIIIKSAVEVLWYIQKKKKNKEQRLSKEFYVKCSAHWEANKLAFSW